MDLEQYKTELQKILSDDFERELLRAAFTNLADVDNKLRFNNFAYSIRELSRHFLKSLAPDDEILEAPWYKNETDVKNGISRGQRIVYAINGGLLDDFVDAELIAIEDRDAVKKELINSINLLSKFTHINASTFGLDSEKINELSVQVLETFKDFVRTITECRELILHELSEKIDQQFIEHTIYATMDEVDILSTHHNILEIHAGDVHFHRIGNRTLELHVNGEIDVRLQYGSNRDLDKGDGAEMFTDFPFHCKLFVEIKKDLRTSEVDIQEFKVNTDSWYE